MIKEITQKYVLFAGLDDITTQILIPYTELIGFRVLITSDLNTTLSEISLKNGMDSDVVLLLFSSRIAKQANRRLSADEASYVLHRMNGELSIMYLFYDEFLPQTDRYLLDGKVAFLNEPSLDEIKVRLLETLVPLTVAYKQCT